MPSVSNVVEFTEKEIKELLIEEAKELTGVTTGSHTITLNFDDEKGKTATVVFNHPANNKKGK